MSLSLSLSAALSGLSLTARGTQLVADNIANAQTEGYGVRALTQAARVTGLEGSGVMSTGITRDVDPMLLADLRHAKALKSQDDVLSDFWTRIESVFGMPDEPGGLTNLINALEVSLQHAATQPDSDALLHKVGQAATDIARSFVTLNDTLQVQRDTADSGIANDVGALNQSLLAIADLNDKIQKQTLLGGAPESLMDARQRLINDVSSIVSIREIPRNDGRVMVMGRDGSILVDRTAAQFGFVRTQAPGPGDTIGNGALSHVTLNGRNLHSENALFSAGRLGALLEIRDTAAPTVQNQLDTRAQDMITRFSQPDLDPSLAPGAFGLFSKAYMSGLPADITGSAGQIRLNPMADPGSGGAVWRLRHGLGLSVEPFGMTLDNSLLSKMLGALNKPSPLPAGTHAAKPAAAHASDALSMIAAKRLAQDQRGAVNMARVSALEDAFAARGVDTDTELSKLLVLEQAYAANARVIATVDAMWRSLLEIR